MAVLAPMPSASASTATMVKPGLLRSIRSPYRRSRAKVGIRVPLGTADATGKWLISNGTLPGGLLSASGTALFGPERRRSRASTARPAGSRGLMSCFRRVLTHCIRARLSTEPGL